ncbi:MAG: SagB/ThcOx family dehydrogenase [Vicinamibacterales bacterium]
MTPLRAVVDRYHDGTKHHFHGFALSLGYLDWASQPRPFRAFSGSPAFPLYPAPSVPAGGYVPPSTNDSLRDLQGAAEPPSAPLAGDLLRHALGLSAWKQFGSSRWSLRVNPSSGNLHPTEAYVVCGSVDGLAETAAVYHYAADRHALELRCAFDERTWRSEWNGQDVLLIALTSIHWREAWKYGERAFRYCQHDLGHAIAAVACAAALAGWRAVLLPAWSHRAIASLTGIDRDEDFIDAEREEPGCILAVGPPGGPPAGDGRRLVEAVRNGRWFGRASQLSEDHVQWTFIDEVARATEDPGRPDAPVSSVAPVYGPERRIILQRRSAVAFDGRSRIDRSAFFGMLSRVMPGQGAAWDVLWWTPRIHLAIFVHRVDDLVPGLYLLARDPSALDRLKAACGRELLWEAAHDHLPFTCLARGDCRALASRLSCDQDIAGDGCFSLGMIADFDASLDTYGASFYRHLFWESGVVGQALYLEAEAAGVRATGIGCFYDDPVHDVLGLQGHAFQSLYHFTVGVAVDDTRLTTEPGYAWEAAPARESVLTSCEAHYRMPAAP